jgi:signal transduction histidine kinase
MTAPVLARPQVTYRYRTSRVAFGMFFLLMGAAFALDSLHVFRVTTGLFWPLLLISLCAGLLLHRARRLMVEEDRSAQLAVAEERVRIARELHDIVAHGVSLMTIQIAAARRVATKSPDSASESLEAAEQTGRQTLTELEGMLAALRGADASIGAAARTGQDPHGQAQSGRTPLPRISDLDSLVDAVRQTGRTVKFDVLGEAPTLPSSVETTVYRLVQEALTNAVRYAGDTPIDIQVIFSPTAITVFVDDEGPGPDGKRAGPGAGGGGHGLAGMRERLAAVGGTLEAGPKNPGPGWRVYATIPVVLLEAA